MTRMNSFVCRQPWPWDDRIPGQKLPSPRLPSYYMTKRRVQAAAAYALARTAPATIASLIELIEVKEPLVRRQVAAALSQMGPKAKAAVPALARLLRDSDREVRRLASRSLVDVRFRGEHGAPGPHGIAQGP